MMVFFGKMMIAQQKKDAKEGQNIFAASRKSKKIAVAVCIQVGLLHDVIHEVRWEDFTPNAKWRLCGEAGKLFLKVSLKARIIQRNVEGCTFSPTRNVLSANTLARRFRIRVHVSTFRIFVTAVVDLEFSSSLETIFFLQAIRHILQITVGITNITITRRKNSKMSHMRLFFSSLQSLQVGNKPRWPKSRTVKGTRVTLHCVVRILWTDGRSLKWWKRQTGATAPQPAVMENTKCIPESIGLSIDIPIASSEPLWQKISYFHNSFFVCHSLQGKLNAFNVVWQTHTVLSNNLPQATWLEFEWKRWNNPLLWLPKLKVSTTVIVLACASCEFCLEVNYNVFRQ